MRKILQSVIALLFIVWGAYAHAQINKEESPDHMILKFSILSLHDFDNTFMFGLEVPFKDNRFTVQQDLGYGNTRFNFYRTSSDRDRILHNFKSVTSFKYYFARRPKVSYYFGLEYMFKRVSRSDMQWVNKDCVDWQCAYSEYMQVKLARFGYALRPKIGWQFYYRNRITIDLHAGIGGQKSVFKTLSPGLEGARYDKEVGLWSSNYYSNNNYTEILPSLTLGFNIGLTLGKFEKKD